MVTVDNQGIPWCRIQPSHGNAGSIPATSTMSKQQQTITKQLQNLYSWTQFYQEVGNKEQIRKCQTEIAQLKKAYNETKTKKNG